MLKDKHGDKSEARKVQRDALEKRRKEQEEKEAITKVSELQQAKKREQTVENLAPIVVGTDGEEKRLKEEMENAGKKTTPEAAAATKRALKK